MRNSLNAPMFEDVFVPAGGIVNYSARSNFPSTNLELGSAEGARSVGCPNRDSVDMKRKRDGREGERGDTLLKEINS